MRRQIEESFLCFWIRETGFLFPLYEVVHILSGKTCFLEENSEFYVHSYGEISILDFREKRGEDKDFQCIIILQGKDAYFGLAVDHIEGILSIEPKDQYEVPRLVIDEKNDYINGIAYWKEKEALLFLLSPEKLETYVIADGGKEQTGIDKKEGEQEEAIQR